MDPLSALNKLVYLTGINHRTGFVAYRDIDYCALGLTGEAGEVAGVIKKIRRNNAGELSEEIIDRALDEMADVLWYLDALRICLSEARENDPNFTWGGIVSRLQNKLMARYRTGTINER